MRNAMHIWLARDLLKIKANVNKVKLTKLREKTRKQSASAEQSVHFYVELIFKCSVQTFPK